MSFLISRCSHLLGERMAGNSLQCGKDCCRIWWLDRPQERKGTPNPIRAGWGGVSRSLLERGGAERWQELVRGIGKGVEAKGSAGTQVAGQGPTGNTSMVLWCREEARARGGGRQDEDGQGKGGGRRASVLQRHRAWSWQDPWMGLD